MARGFLSGIFWGGIVGLGALLVSSQMLERQQLSFPQPQASEVNVPGGSEFDQARPETDPVLPNPESRPDAEAVAGVAVPDDAVETPPDFDTTALEVPTPAPAPDGLTEAPEASEAPPEPPATASEERPADEGVDLAVPESPGTTPEPETEAPGGTQTPEAVADTDTSVSEADETPTGTEVAALPTAEEEAPIGSGTGTAPTVTSEDTAPLAPSAPSIGEEPALPTASDDDTEAPSLPQIVEPEAPGAGQAPAISEAPASPTAPEAPASSDVEAPQIAAVEPEPEDETGTDGTSGAGTVRADGGSESFLKPVENLEDQAENVETDRLPRIGGGGGGVEAPSQGLPTVRRLGTSSEEEETAEVDDAPEDDAPAVAEEGGPALLTYRSTFENTEGRPLLSLVLVHNEAAPLSPEILDALPPHAAFGVEAGAPDAANIAESYRAAGREVVMIPSLPQGATPQDVEQALRVNFETIPHAVAVMDVTGGSFQSDRNAVEQVVDVVMDTGHGLITFPRGLNAAHQRAERAGVPTGLIFRQLDASGESAEQIRRTMDRAAFRARQDEAVILVGSTSDATLRAIVEWAMGNRASSVTIAPISAALTDG